MNIGISSQEGVKACLKNFTRYLKKVDEIESIDLANLAVRVSTRAAQLAPLKSGRLEAGVYAIVSRNKNASGIRAGAVASSRGYNYAPIQHENLEFKHPVKGEALFVQKALEEGIEEFQNEVARRLSNFD